MVETKETTKDSRKKNPTKQVDPNRERVVGDPGESNTLPTEDQGIPTKTGGHQPAQEE